MPARGRGAWGAAALLVLVLACAAAGRGRAERLPSLDDAAGRFQVLLETDEQGNVEFGLEQALRAHEAQRLPSDTTRTGSVPVATGYRNKVKRCLWCRGYVDASADLDKRDFKNLKRSTAYKKAASEQGIKRDESWKSHLTMSLDRAERLYWAPPQVPEPEPENDIHDFHRRMRHYSSTKGLITMFNFRLCVNEQSQTFAEGLAAAAYGDDGYHYECTNSRRNSRVDR